MARCRECQQREAVPAAVHPLMLLPLRLFGAGADRDGWCRGCADSLNVLGLFAWALLLLALRWLWALLA